MYLGLNVVTAYPQAATISIQFNAEAY